MQFEYNFVRKEDIKVEYLNNLLRILPKDGVNMGKMTDTDDVLKFYKRLSMK